jgi:hypothetical protein
MRRCGGKHPREWKAPPWYVCVIVKSACGSGPGLVGWGHFLW